MKRLAAGMLAAALALFGNISGDGGDYEKDYKHHAEFRGRYTPGHGFRGRDGGDRAHRGQVFRGRLCGEERGVQWEEDSVPKLEITLVASDGYRFSSIKQDKLRLKGAGQNM